MRRFAAILLLPVLLIACRNEMDPQPRYSSYEPSKLFADGKSMQAPPEGAIARDDPDPHAIESRPPMTMALLARGRERYDIYCTPCHDYSGTGHGTVIARGFPAPQSFHIVRLQEAPSSYFVDVITHGRGVMYSFADRITPDDRWAIAAYIRALQTSQNAPVANLNADDRAKLGSGS